jgi:NAD(P)H-dependent flavin oxidoreductase YrpB (nitropropane dioxygenase family)
MRTRATELLGIKYPIIQAPMGPISVPRLVAAVSNAGGLGILNVGRFTPEEIREDIRAVRELTDKPFGVNLTAGTPGYERLAEAMINEKVPLIVHGRGNPKWLIGTARGSGILIMAQIGAVRHALRAEQDGADILCVAGHEAGGHVSHVSTMVLTPLVASKVKIPVVAAGGFCDGMGLVAALALGAEAVALGTRFAISQESGLPENLKLRYVAASEEDTLVTPLITGTGLRVLRNRFTATLEGGGQKLSWREKVSGTLETRRRLGVSWWRFIVGGWRMKSDYEASFSELSNLAAGAIRIGKAMKEGDEECGAMIVGQVCGRIGDIPSAGDIVQRIVTQAYAVLEPLRDKLLS